MNKLKCVDIYVKLLDEGVNVYKPVDAFLIEKNIYIIDSTLEVPEDEKWEFIPGTKVVCEMRNNCFFAVSDLKEKSFSSEIKNNLH